MTTYGEVLASNLRAARSRAGISQNELAERMRAAGFDAWISQTVSQSEQGRRRILAEEVSGLAKSLGTTAERLMSPLPEDGMVELVSGGACFPAGFIRSLTMRAPE